MTRPVVSVVIPTFNRAMLLPRAAESVIRQTFADWEIVVVDDGSTDATPTLAERYAARLGERWVYLRQENRGSSAARNRGIEAARGEFVAFLDSDDEFAPCKLERQVELFRQLPHLGLVYNDYSIVDGEGAALGTAFDTKFPIARIVPSREVAPGAFECVESLFNSLIQGYFVSTITGMVRRSVLGETIRFSEKHAYAEEWLFFLEVARATRAGFVDEPLSIHHYTAGSLARADKHRNLLGMRALLEEMRRRFSDASRPQRRAIRSNLSRVCRQLGQEAAAERPMQAVCLALEAFLHEPTLRTLRACLGLALGTILSQAGDPSKPEPRDRTQVRLGGVR